MKKRWISLLAAALMLGAAMLPVSASEETAEAKKNSALIYEETFDYADESDQNAALAQLGWVTQTKAMGAYTDPTAVVSIVDGKLSVVGSSDTYYLMLSEEDMAPYAGQTITIQYDVEYTTASNSSRYFCILANYAGKKYNSFHFRNNGSGNNQTHYDGSWYTYDLANGPADAYAAAQDNGTGTSIAMKLLGVKYNGESLFSQLPVTIRYVLDPNEGISVYMKKAEDPEGAFVLVSVHDGSSDGASRYGTWSSNAICVKIGGAQNGYMDNIAVWTGGGDYPQPEPEVVEPETEEPAEEEAEPATEELTEEETQEDAPKKVKEPQTIVNKIAVWAVALFGGWIIVKKGKESEQGK